jgi:ADP-ribosylarginine hydrolase
MLQMTNQVGVSALVIKLPGFNLSDDTVMHIATAEGFLENATHLPTSVRPPDATEATPLSFHHRCTLIAQAYVRSFDDMDGRAAGSTTGCSIAFLERHGIQNWHALPFNKSHGGCGAAMRSAPLGLVFPHANQVKDLVAYGVESGRMTHHGQCGISARQMCFGHASRH